MNKVDDKIQPDFMARIHLTQFHEMSEQDQFNHINYIRLLREQSLAESRVKKGRQTKSAKKNLKSKGKKTQNLTSDLSKLLKKMSPEDVKKLLQG